MAYRNYFRSMFNDNFKILTWVLILFISITPNFIFINAAHAGAAEKWDYDVIPDQNQKLDIKGHKVDGYGNAANDYEYNRKIDPTTAANRSKMGAVGMGRLLKITGWGLLGTAALEGLLEAVDWVIDPEAQSIWRYKKTGDTSVSCSYKTTYYDGTIKQKKFYADDGSESFCPYSIALKRLTIRVTTASYPAGTKLEFIAWDPLITLTTSNFRFRFKVIRPTGSPTEEYLDVPHKDVPAPEGEKEILTQEQLADYANHTHPDFADPELAPKLNPKWNPNIAPDLWKPANPWEYDNSPTVQEVKKELEQAKPEPKDDKIKENEPDPETGGKSFSLPAFCSWATSVCEFIDSFKEQPENDNNTQIDVQNLDETLIFDDSQRFSFSNSCPNPEQFSVSFFGTTQNLEFSYQPLCDFMSMIKPFVIAGSYLIGAYIVMGLSRGSGE